MAYGLEASGVKQLVYSHGAALGTFVPLISSAKWPFKWPRMSWMGFRVAFEALDLSGFCT